MGSPNHFCSLHFSPELGEARGEVREVGKATASRSFGGRDETRHSHERQHKCICLSVHRSTDLTSFNDSVSNPEEEVSLFHDGFHLQDCHDPPWRVRVEQTQQVLRMVNRKRKNSVLVEKSPFAGITAGRRDKSLTLGF